MRGKGRGNEESRRGRGGAMTEFSVVALCKHSLGKGRGLGEEGVAVKSFDNAVTPRTSCQGFKRNGLETQHPSMLIKI